MSRLSPLDQMFLLIEKRQQPMHVALLQVFTFPEDAGPNYVRDMAEHMRECRQARPPFNQRLMTRFGQAFWQDDEQFDLDHHFRHFALPKPGRIRELLALVSAEHSNPLDRQRPLWEVYLIEGIQGRRFALYTKLHHSLMDGVTAMRMNMRVLSSDPYARELPPIWAVEPRRRPSADMPDSPGVLTRLRAGLSQQLATLPAVLREIGKLASKARRDPEFVSVFQAPYCLLNKSITGSRRFAAQSYSLPRIKALAGTFGCTVNDVVLAICSSALRRYLLQEQALPAQPLIAMVPVSLRQGDSEGGGNQVGVILANLETHLIDPGQRLQAIRASVSESKARFKDMSPAEILNYTALTLAPTGMSLLTGLAPDWQAFNVVISNVPGPKEPLYLNGARMQGMWPVSIVLDRVALNITLTSYADQLEFGLIACRRTMPRMQRMLDYLEEGISELELAAPTAALAGTQRRQGSLSELD